MVFGSNKKKKEEPVVEMETETLEDVMGTVNEADLTSTGFSLIKHPESGFAVVILKFNPVTMQATVKEVRKVGDSRMDAEDQFKIEVGRYFADQEARS